MLSHQRMYRRRKKPFSKFFWEKGKQEPFCVDKKKKWCPQSPQTRPSEEVEWRESERGRRRKSSLLLDQAERRDTGQLSRRRQTRWKNFCQLVSRRKMIYLLLISQKGENSPPPKKIKLNKRKFLTRRHYSVPSEYKEWLLYPSSLGGVYQPEQKITQEVAIVPTGVYIINIIYYSSSYGLIIGTYHSFRESGPGICMTVVLWQDCTGSERGEKSKNKNRSDSSSTTSSNW